MEAHLEPGGVAQMFCNWPQRRGADWRAELRSWFEATSCDVLVLASEAMDTVDYASLWLRQQHETDDAVGRAIEEWLGFYERAGIESLGEGLVVQHRVTDRPPWIEIRDAPATRGAAGESIAGLLKARDRLARLPDAVALLDLALRPAPDLERHDRRRPSAEGWGSAKSELRLASGYAFAARVDPVAAALVGRLDGTRTVREAAAVVAGSVGIPLESLLPGLPELVRKLMQLGLLR
jgi:hypothetical protein